MSTIIWVVEGESGRDNNYEDWLVRAFREEDRASQHMSLLNGLAQELMTAYEGGNNDWGGLAFLAALGDLQEHDQNAEFDGCTGIKYFRCVVELEDPPTSEVPVPVGRRDMQL